MNLDGIESMKLKYHNLQDLFSARDPTIPQKPNTNPRMIELASIQISFRLSPFLCPGVSCVSGPVRHFRGRGYPHSPILTLYIDASSRVPN